MLLAILYTNMSNLFFGIQIILRMTQCSGIWYFLPQVVNFSDKRTSSVQPVAQFWTKIIKLYSVAEICHFSVVDFQTFPKYSL